MNLKNDKAIVLTKENFEIIKSSTYSLNNQIIDPPLQSFDHCSCDLINVMNTLACNINDSSSNNEIIGEKEVIIALEDAITLVLLSRMVISRLERFKPESYKMLSKVNSFNKLLVNSFSNKQIIVLSAKNYVSTDEVFMRTKKREIVEEKI